MPLSTVLAQLSLIIAITVLPFQNVVAKSPKCDDGMAYVGKPPITVTIATPSVEDKTKSKTRMEQQTPLEAAFADMMVNSKAHSMTVGLAGASGPIWTETGGLKGQERLHYWASVGKAYTAVVIMQLVENNQLSLNDRLSKWVKGVPNGELITIKMLLNHTSGLYSTNEDQAATNSGAKSLSLKEHIKVLKKHGALFCPGQYWRYSNTGYYFLGLIAEQIYAQPLPQILETQIFDKLHLRNSRALSSTDVVSDIATPHPSDNQPSDLRSPGAAGPIAATSDEMIVFWRALLAGDLVSPKTRDAMFTELYPMFDDGMFYGLGVMAVRLPQPDGPPKTWVGHAGGMPGIRAFVMIDPEAHDYSAAALTGEGPATAVAYQMLRIWQELVVP